MTQSVTKKPKCSLGKLKRCSQIIKDKERVEINIKRKGYATLLCNKNEICSQFTLKIIFKDAHDAVGQMTGT